ncbi:hypothetical protein Tco_0631605, partial [Tanacetum coccineum]
GTKENIDAGQARKKTVSSQEYILLPLLTSDQSLSKGLKDSPDNGFKPSREEEKKDYEDPGNQDSEVPSIKEPRINQKKDANVNNTNNINIVSDGNNTNNVNTVSSTVNAAGLEDNVAHENIVYGCDDDLNMPNLEEIAYSNDDEEVGAEADINNLAITVPGFWRANAKAKTVQWGKRQIPIGADGQEEVNVGDLVTTADEVVTTANVEVTTASAPTTTIDELTLAQTLIEIKAAKPKAVTTAATITKTTRPKARGVVVQEPSEFKTTSSPSQASQLPQAKDKGKEIMVEPEKPLKKKDQIALDEEVDRNLEA